MPSVAGPAAERILAAREAEPRGRVIEDRIHLMHSTQRNERVGLLGCRPDDHQLDQLRVAE